MIAHKYRLRCRFEYADGKPSWISQWDRSGPLACDSAWAQTKEGLLCAIVEGKLAEGSDPKVLAECAGQDFCNFEWMAAVATVGTATHFGKMHDPIIVGLVIVARNERLTIYRDGSMRIDPRSDVDKKIHLAGYGQ